MPYAVEVVSDGKYILVKHFGIATIAEVDELREMVFALAEREGIRRVLLDVREMQNTFSTVEIFELTERHAAYPTPAPKPRCALLARDDQKQDSRFIEDVSMNRGLPLKTFTDPAQALHWLAA